MGGVLSALIAIGGSIAAAAEAYGLIAATWGVAYPVIYSALTSGGIASVAGATGVAAASTFVAGASTFALVQTGWVLTTFGTAVLSGIAIAAAASTIIGLTVSLTRSGPQETATVLSTISKTLPLICRLTNSKDGCPNLYSDNSKRTVRIFARQTKQPTVLSYATPVRVSRKRYNSSNTSRTPAKSRKVSKSSQRLRSKGRK